MIHAFHSWLATFGLDETLQSHVADVVQTLPPEVRDDFVTDPAFRLVDYDPRAPISHISVSAPAGHRRPSRSVVLKRTLRNRPPAFVRYIIAHELAHAHLRNAGRWPGDDPEHAADALAAAWGHPRPPQPWG